MSGDVQGAGDLILHEPIVAIVGGGVECDQGCGEFRFRMTQSGLFRLNLNKKVVEGHAPNNTRK
ncbi:hypothetical protein GCM10022247_55620 [Allokutzneria multivorans]|uniref:Uncharacterized protein n=1 Tax=Allokutzneria multivorans TaxID=1142134 RepID=A0ABP7TBU7_9PSEU